MIRRTAMFLPLLAASLALAQCAPPPAPVGQTRADAAALAACRERADEVYDRTHRDTIYTISNRDTPYSANYAPSVGRGLSDRFGRDNMVRDCVRNSGAEDDRTATAPDTRPTAPAKP